MFIVPYQITTLDPIICTALLGEPNSAVSSDYIPGSMVRGMVIGAYMKSNAFNLAEDEVQRLFFSRQVQYLNANILLHDEQGNPHTSYPVPMTWQQYKYHADETIFDSAASESKQGDTQNKRKNVKGFAAISPDEGIALVESPRKTIHVHTQRRRHQAVDQLVYRYEALAAEQIFEGEIRCNDEDDAKLIEGLLSAHPEQVVGGARTAGYGRVRVDVAPYIEWQYNAPASPDWIVTVLSHTILRNKYGQQHVDLSAWLQELNRHGIAVKKEQVRLALTDTQMVGGFNRKWGLPLPQSLAIQASSVICLDNVDVSDENQTAIEDLLWYGMGERTNEGFGQIAINWQSQPTWKEGETRLAQPANKAVQSTAAGRRMIEKLEKQIEVLNFNRQVSDLLYRKQSEAEFRIEGNITRTQLARLRNVIKNELQKAKPDLSEINKFFAEIQGKAAGVKFAEARIGNDPLDEWVQNELRAKWNDVRECLIFIDSVLERGQKDKQREKQGGNHG